MNWIKALFTWARRPHQSSAQSAGSANLRYEPGGLKAMGDIPRYPPFTEGLPAASPMDLLQTQEGLIRQLKHELALPPELDTKLINPLLVSYASFVHLLPASKAHHHRGAGGMLRHGLEVALWATRGFHGKIIDGHESGERRKVLEPRWRLAVAVAGLCHDIGKTAYDVVVTDASGKKVWDVYGGLLSEWIQTESLDRYFISWRSGREHKVHERFGHLLTMRVIPREVLSYLNEGDPKIIAVMHETIAGQAPKGPSRVVYELVMAADQRSVQRDIKGQRVADSDSALGVPVAKYLVDAMKRLVDQGAWKANEEGQPLWVSGNGVFLDWEKAVPAMIQLLEADGIAGIPRSPHSIAESLGDFDVIRKQITPDGEESYYLPVAPEKLCSKKRVHEFRAVEINGLDIFFDGPHPAPVEVHSGAGAIHARQEANEKREKKLAEERNERALKRHEEKVVNSDGQSRPVLEENAPEPTAKTDEPDIVPQQNAVDDLPEVEEADLTALEQSNASNSDAEEVDDDPASDASWINQLTPDQRSIIEACFIPGKCEHAFAIDGQVVLRYPAGMASFGDARNEKLEAIKPLLAPHPTVPGKPTQKRTIQGKAVNVLVLAPEASEYLLSTVPEPEEAQDPAPPAKRKPATKKQASDKKDTKKAKPKKKAAAPKPATSSSPAEEGPKEESKQKAAKADKPASAKQTANKAPKKTAASKPTKPKPQQPPKITARNNPLIGEIREKVLSEYPNKRIEDGEAGGTWVSASDAAMWYVKNVRPDMSLGSVITALYQLKDITDKSPPNNDKDFVLVTEKN